MQLASLKKDIAGLQARVNRRDVMKRLEPYRFDLVGFAAFCGFTDLDDWQAELLTSPANRILVNVSRQGGKSTMTALKALHAVVFNPGALLLVISPSSRQSKEMLGKVRTAYRALFGSEVIELETDRSTTLELWNGSRLEALPGKFDTTRGYSAVFGLIIDEAAWVPDPVIHAMMPVLAVSGGWIMELTTPAGQRGAFYTAWQDGGEGWQRFEIPAVRIPRIPASFLAQEKKDLPAWFYRQEYECSFEANMDSVFSPDDIRHAFTDDVQPLDWEALGAA